MIANFDSTYNGKCPYVTDITIGSVCCTGMNLNGVKIKPCKHYISHTDKTVFVPVLNKFEIVTDSINCDKENNGYSQLIFDFDI